MSDSSSRPSSRGSNYNINEVQIVSETLPLKDSKLDSVHDKSAEHLDSSPVIDLCNSSALDSTDESIVDKDYTNQTVSSIVNTGYIEKNTNSKVVDIISSP